jgi:2-oxoglutarate ferredoxin oxidoreductase subunit beta
MDNQPPNLSTRSFKQKDFKSDIQPIWCPGCGDFGVQAALFRALAGLGKSPEEIVIVSGIGCSSRLPAYTTAYGFHGIHGRALAVGTGLKLVRPDLLVIVAGGDGDGFSIGGNHFLHACRRNIDLTYIVMDNEVYGMTKGQPSPTTAPDWNSMFAPGGTGIIPFKPLELALAAGANFIARGFYGDPNNLAQLLLQAINHPGLSFVHVLSNCVTYRPEQRVWKELVHTANWAVPTEFAEAVRRLNDDDGFTIGVFFAGTRPAYSWTFARSADLSQLTKIEQEFLI